MTQTFTITILSWGHQTSDMLNSVIRACYVTFSVKLQVSNNININGKQVLKLKHKTTKWYTISLQTPLAHFFPQSDPAEKRNDVQDTRSTSEITDTNKILKRTLAKILLFLFFFWVETNSQQ